MAGSMPSFGSLALHGMQGVVLLVLASYVALELAHRVRQPASSDRNLWLAATALAWAGGVAATLTMQLSLLPQTRSVGFEPVSAIVAVLPMLLLGAAAAHWTFVQQVGWARVFAGAALFALAALSAQVLLLGSVGLLPGIRWDAPGLALSWLVSAGGMLWALLVALPQVDTGVFRFRPRQLLSAGIAAVCLTIGQVLAVAAATLPGPRPAHDGAPIANATMANVVSLGVAELLLLLLLVCAIESRLRGKLGAAQGAAQADALRDTLTKLPARTTFEGTLAQVLRQADAASTPAVLLHVALDRFNAINDHFGHQAGDAVLKSVARRLRELTPPHRVARLGGDEFLLLIDGDDAPQKAEELAGAVLESIAQPHVVDGREIGLSCSIGMARYPQHGAQAALLNHATVATRASKSCGGATYSVFDPRMVDDVRDQAELLNDLRLALSRGQLDLYYQPKIHAPTAQITAAEALLRWHHPRRGMISPTVFIPLAERHGLIGSIGAWVIDEACRQAREWRDQGLRMRVAVNLSAHQLRQQDLPAHIAATLAKHQINPELLTCEITESVAMEDTEATLRFFTELAAVGVHISIDDFGAGYSSLAYLRKLPATELKVDRGFVLDLENSEGARKIAQAVVNLAQALNMKVVAEGVETDAQYQILRSMGYDQVQGFLFAKPMTAKALALWATGTEGPRSIQFRESLFKETMALTA